MSTAAAPSNRYIRQEILGVVGAAGQERLARAHAALIGAGALGSTIADLLVRAGIGRLTLIDRDYVELHNLQRQTLYTEEDVREHTPKAMAAAERLSAINSSVEVRPVVADVNSISIEQGGCVLIERWSGADGSGGISLNFYNPVEKIWTQTWVSPGTVLTMTGKLVDGEMVLEGPLHYLQNARVTRLKGTWTRLPDGRLRQHFVESRDEGKTWNEWFDGYYSRI